MTAWQDIRAARVFEDNRIIALDKAAGVAVTGERHDSDIIELARESGEVLYPVHRIDKVTSGIVLLAKDLTAHGVLTRQFNKRTADKRYLAVVGRGLPARGTIDLPLSVGRKNRVRIAAPREKISADIASGTWTVASPDVFPVKNYPSITEFVTVADDEEYSILAVRPVTGRRHQIRVHLAWIGYPIVGDPLFIKAAGDGSVDRTYLHSWQLAVDAPWLDNRLRLHADPAPDFWAPLTASGSRSVRDALERAHS